MIIHQLLPCLLYGDAIGNHALALKGLLREWGHDSEIYATDIHPRLANEGKPLSHYKPTRHTLTLYHHAFMGEASERFLKAPGKRVFIYHNITPHAYFEGYNAEAQRLTREARAQLDAFKGANAAWGDSAYNCDELRQRGYRRVEELPILVNFDDFDKTPPSPEVLNRYKDGLTNFLFVGRIAPNKCQADVIRVFAHYHHFIDKRSRLLLVGSHGGMEIYLDELKALTAALGLDEHVVFTGHTRFDELVAYYQLGDIFLSMSEHEGFCVPLLEAMRHEVPIVAYASSAIPGTLGNAGWLLREKHFEIAAEACHLLVTDAALRAKVLATQRERLADYSSSRVASGIQQALEPLIQKPHARYA